MTISKLMSLISLIGLIVIIASVVWWQQTYGVSIDMAKCLVVKDTACRLGGLKAAFSDLPAYNPVAMWVGLIGLFGGSILRRIM